MTVHLLKGHTPLLLSSPNVNQGKSLTKPTSQTPDDTSESNQVDISTVSTEFAATTVSTTNRDICKRDIVAVSDPEDSILSVDSSNPQTMSQDERDMQVMREAAQDPYLSVQISNVRTAGDSTLDDAQQDDEAQQGEDRDEENQGEEGDPEGEKGTSRG